MSMDTFTLTLHILNVIAVPICIWQLVDPDILTVRVLWFISLVLNLIAIAFWIGGV